MSFRLYDTTFLSPSSTHSKDGFLFDKESILQYIITKKNEYSRKLKEYERQKKIEDTEAQQSTAVIEMKKLQKFINTEQNIVTLNAMPSTSSSASTSTTSAISNMANGKEKELPSFWVPSQAPTAKVSKAEKPDSIIYCPISQKPMKVKDLIAIKFTMVNDPDDTKSLIVKENRYMCAVTHDILSNSVPCVVLKTR